MERRNRTCRLSDAARRHGPHGYGATHLTSTREPGFFGAHTTCCFIVIIIHTVNLCQFLVLACEIPPGKVKLFNNKQGKGQAAARGAAACPFLSLLTLGEHRTGSASQARDLHPGPTGEAEQLPPSA
jgi:hypothetical protein